MPASCLSRRRSNGRNQTARVIAPSVAAIGRSKNADRCPSDLIIEVMKFSSSIPPSTTPRIAGATGKPLASRKYAATLGLMTLAVWFLPLLLRRLRRLAGIGEAA